MNHQQLYNQYLICKRKVTFQDELHGKIEEVIDVPQEILNFIGLENCRIDTINQDELILINNSLTELKNIFPKAYYSILRWTDGLIKVKPIDKNWFGSGSYVEFMHCTVFTKMMFNFLPPVTKLPNGNFFGAQENLYHESLHHQISKGANRINVFDRSKSVYEVGEIYISWHDKIWPLEQSMQAFYVYRHVLEMRLFFAQNVYKQGQMHDLLISAAEIAKSALEELQLAISSKIKTFDPKIGLLWEAMQTLQPDEELMLDINELNVGDRTSTL